MVAYERINLIKKEQNDESVHLAGFAYISSAPKSLNKEGGYSDANIRIKNSVANNCYFVKRVD